ncbi:hypothetical protein KC360_g3242 [Hortaea werneckii]|nr:hypothetical protein KC361_g3905 [Hortaea werneckii]KAI6885875.1 hypothetical protein KC325_g3290 [Hortaea werneckii]KAI6997925.1 hypothetical protein KC359_g2747 [Hortaea werneckii]KAI7084018.1 hypothetical protein KC356_g7089 [Hortaea werneckii]KAI7148844.1 hypothetical protein KC344_g1626 [Hortaea werneckii]
MATSIFPRAIRPSIISSTESSAYVCQACRRHQSSYRRTRKALRVKPDASFLPSTTEAQDHIIFNPPSSSPNVYHTPMAFLPANDPRRKLHSVTPTRSATPPSTPSTSNIPSSTSNETRTVPPPVRPLYEKKYHLTPEQIEEMRKLRAEDPKLWTRVRLAEKFECSQFFVSLCCSAPQIKEERERELEEIKRRWGRRKTEAREARQERKKLWGRDA